MYTNIQLYFTSWTVIMVIFHRYLYKYVNLLYLTFITMVCGLYISYINPRVYKVRLFNEDYSIDGAEKLIIVDLFFHVLSFVFIVSLYKSYYTPIKIDIPFLIAVSIAPIYSLIISTMDLYNINRFEMVSIFIIANLGYLLLFDKK